MSVQDKYKYSGVEWVGEHRMKLHATADTLLVKIFDYSHPMTTFNSLLRNHRWRQVEKDPQFIVWEHSKHTRATVAALKDGHKKGEQRLRVMFPGEDITEYFPPKKEKQRVNHAWLARQGEGGGDNGALASGPTGEVRRSRREASRRAAGKLSEPSRVDDASDEYAPGSEEEEASDEESEGSDIFKRPVAGKASGRASGGFTSAGTGAGAGQVPATPSVTFDAQAWAEQPKRRREGAGGHDGYDVHDGTPLPSAKRPKDAAAGESLSSAVQHEVQRLVSEQLHLLIKSAILECVPEAVKSAMASFTPPPSMWPSAASFVTGAYDSMSAFSSTGGLMMSHCPLPPPTGYTGFTPQVPAPMTASTPSGGLMGAAIAGVPVPDASLSAEALRALVLANPRGAPRTEWMARLTEDQVGLLRGAFVSLGALPEWHAEVAPFCAPGTAGGH